MNYTMYKKASKRLNKDILYDNTHLVLCRIQIFADVWKYICIYKQ